MVAEEECINHLADHRDRTGPLRTCLLEQRLLSGEPRWREQLVQGLEGPLSRHQSRGREMEKRECMIVGP